MEEEFQTQRQKIFIKRLIKKVPEFDWSIFGPAIVGYAEDLKIEIAEDIRKRKEEIAVKEAELAAKLAQNEQTQRGQDDGEHGGDAECTNKA